MRNSVLWCGVLGRIKAVACAGIVLSLTALGALAPARAQEVGIPNFWNSRAQLYRPDLGEGRTIRFLVDDDFPPLHFPGLDGTPTGLSV